MSCVFLIDHIFIITLNILIEANFQIRILEDGIHFGFDQKPESFSFLKNIIMINKFINHTQMYSVTCLKL